MEKLIPKTLSAVRKHWHLSWALLTAVGLLVVGVGALAVTEQPIEGIELQQNYPNPFGASTEIQYTIPSDGHVSLRVFNMLGQEVQSLVNETKTAGEYTTRFDGSSFPSGQYTYSLVFTPHDNGQLVKLTKKMYLMR
jgi:hypothetical protein